MVSVENIKEEMDIDEVRTKTVEQFISSLIQQVITLFCPFKIKSIVVCTSSL